MCKCSPLQRTIWILANLITALAAIHIGLQGFGINLLHGPLIQMQLNNLIRYVDIVIGLAGFYILFTSLLWSFKGHSCSCD